MQRRLIASVVGGVIGLCLASPLQNALGVSTAVAFVAAALGGIALAWVASTLFDVFSGTPGTPPE